MIQYCQWCTKSLGAGGDRQAGYHQDSAYCTTLMKAKQKVPKNIVFTSNTQKERKDKQGFKILFGTPIKKSGLY